MAVPSFLSWSKSPITFDHRDHPSHIARPGSYPLVVDPIVRKKRLTKVLMDRGSGLNILYVDTLDAIHIPRSELRSVGSPFHGVIPGAQAYPLRQIDLPVTFGGRSNFRSEVLTFEALKMPGPNGVITMSNAFSQAFMCDRGHYELTTAVVNSSELPRLRESSTPVVPDCNKLTSSTAFRPLEETKAPSDMPGIPREVVEHALRLISGSKPAKQRLRHFDDERSKAIGEEIAKLLAAGFIREVFHSDWLAYPILVKKKTGK
ncbi:uncharacterized protein [Miscanthus floridulus]|uniref:uncharacterized protein n=1 Tax=Miscanthus floridulus TaxID=154761 RepID=UPI003457CE44